MSKPRTDLGTIDNRDPLLLPTEWGFFIFGRAQFFAFLAFPILFFGAKIGDVVLKSNGNPNSLFKEPWQWVMDGVYRKLDDVSFWTAVVGLFCAGLIGTSLLNLFAHDPKVNLYIAPRFKHLICWILLVLFGWAVYMYAIYFPTDKGTFFSSLPGEKRCFQIVEGILNLALIAYGYGIAVIGWLARAEIVRRLAKLTQPGGTPAERHLLQAATNLVNLALIFVPVAVVIFFLPIMFDGIGSALYARYKWPVFDFQRFGFDPFSGFTKDWHILLFNFLLLYSPFAAIGVSLLWHRPAGSYTNWVLSRQALGATFWQHFETSRPGSTPVKPLKRFIRSLNLAIWRWYS